MNTKIKHKRITNHITNHTNTENNQLETGRSKDETARRLDQFGPHSSGMIPLAFKVCNKSRSYFVSPPVKVRPMGGLLVRPMGERQLSLRSRRCRAGSESLKAPFLGIVHRAIDLCPLGNMERVKSYLLLLSAVFVFVVVS